MNYSHLKFIEDNLLFHSISKLQTLKVRILIEMLFCSYVNYAYCLEDFLLARRNIILKIKYFIAD